MSRAVACFALIASLFNFSGARLAFADTLPGAGGWSPAAGAVGDNTYEGFIDQPQAGSSVAAGAPFHVSGWVVDMSADGWAGIDRVDIALGSNVIAHAVVGENRPDVAQVTGNGFWAASGFDAVVPGGSVPGGSQSLTVLAHTPAKGSWAKSVTVNAGGAAGAATAAPTGLVLTISSPGANEDVLANKNGQVHGSAYDTRTRAELGSGVDRVDVYLDGARGQPGSQRLGEATGFNVTWTIGWEPTRYDSGERHHVLWIYAHSAVTGEEVLQQREINIVH